MYHIDPLFICTINYSESWQVMKAHNFSNFFTPWQSNGMGKYIDLVNLCIVDYETVTQIGKQDW